MLNKIAIRIAQHPDTHAVLIHPERTAELWRDLAEQRWYNDETGEVMKGIPPDREPDGAVVRIHNVPVFEAAWLPLRTPDGKPIEFYLRRLQKNGTSLFQSQTFTEEHP